ncbi:adenine nucleotide alpha hydrolase [Flavihumibacter sp. R14]|nr:adenine nucleotide alpha hydrolase [Flavihumibacter soli]
MKDQVNNTGNNRNENAVIFWSGGKDSAMALQKAREYPGLNIVGLVTTVTVGTGKTSVHEISEAAIERQAVQTGLPLTKMVVEEHPANSLYEQKLLELYRELKNKGVSTIIYGDIFLEDIKIYREDLLRKAGLKAVFPLWKLNSADLMQYFIRSGFKAITCCVNTSQLDEAFLDRMVDSSFLNDLPENVDPAGENGEFHTFCFDGPVFRHPVNFKTGNRHFRTFELRSGEQTTVCRVELIEVL